MWSRDLFHVLVSVLCMSACNHLTVAQTTTGDACPPVDLYFLMETSRPVTSSSFTQMIMFMERTIQRFIINPDSTRVSLTLFSKTIRDMFDLNTYKTSKDITDYLGSSLYKADRSPDADVGNALQWMADNKFKEEKGRRPEVEAVCVVIVEGKSGDDVREGADSIDKFCRVIVFGVNRADFFELVRIASEPSIGHVKTLQRHLDLGKQIGWVTGIICKPPLVSPRLRRTEPLPTSIIVSWDDQEFAVHYTVIIRNADTNDMIEEITKVPKERTLVEFTGLQQATSYIINAWAVDKNGDQGPRATMFSTTALRPPTIFLNETSVTSRGAKIWWKRNEITDASYYVTVRKVEDRTVVDTRGTFVTQYTATKLEPGIGYVIEVRAVHIGISSDFSNGIVFYTVPASPQAKMRYATSQAVGLGWNEVPGATGYVIRTFDADNRYQQTRRDVVQVNNIHIQPLKSGNVYKFVVTSQNFEGRESAESNEIVHRTSPANPTIHSDYQVTTTTISLTWDHQKAAMRYKVSYQQEGVVFGRPTVLETTDNAIQLNKLKSGTKYEISIQSFGANGETDENAIVTQVIQTAPMKIAVVDVKGTTTDTISLEWTSVEGATYYLIELRPSKLDIRQGFEVVIANVTTTSHTIENLPSGVRYAVTLTAVTDTEMKGEPSKVIYVTTSPGSPSKPFLEQATSDSLVIGWPEVKGAVSYIVLYKREGRNQWTQVTIRGTKHYMQQLRDGTIYEFALRSVGEWNVINNVLSPVLKTQTVPLKPTDLMITDVTTNSISVEWTEARGAHHYVIRLHSTDEFSFTEDRLINTTETSLTLENLNPGETYEIFASSAGLDGVSPETRAVSDTTLPITPGQPEAIEIKGTEVTIEWESIKGAENYVVNVAYGSTVKKYESTEPVYTVTWLPTGTWIRFQVQSMGTRRRLNPNLSPVLSLQTSPAAPKNLQVVATDVDVITLSWDAVVGAKTYIIEYSSSGVDAGLDEGSLDTEETSITVSGLLTGTDYQFSIYVIGTGKGRTDSTEPIFDRTLPNAPSLPEVVEIESTAVTLRWAKVKGAEKYIVTTRKGSITTETEALVEQVAVRPLEEGQFYEFSVRSVGLNGRENPETSPSVTVQTLPDSPKNVNFVASTTSSITLQWDEVTGVKLYMVEVHGPDDMLEQVKTTTKQSITIVNLDSGVEYTFTIVATSVSDRIGKPSVPFVMSTVPLPPTELIIVSTTQTTIEVDWNDVQGASSYNLITRGRDDDSETKTKIVQSKAKVENLIPGNWYIFSVQSIGSLNRVNEDESETLQVQTMLSSPTNIRLINAATEDIEITWDVVNGAKEYVVEMRRAMPGVLSPVITETVTMNKYLAEKLKPGNTYSFQVTAVAENSKRSQSSEPFISATMTDVPEAPHVHSTTNTSVDLEWGGILGAAKYIIYARKNDGTLLKFEETDSHITIDNLESGTWYEFYLQSVSMSGWTSSYSASVRAQTVPSLNKKIIGNLIGNDFMILTWEPIKGVVRYFATIEWMDDLRGLQEKFQETEEAMLDIRDLEPGTHYDIHIAMLSESGVKTGESAAYHGSTLSARPGKAEMKDTKHSSIIFDWEPVKGAESYIVTVSSDEDKTVSTITDEESFIAHGLKPGVTYSVTLVSLDEKNRTNHEKSEPLLVQTVPMQPSSVSMENPTPTAMNIEFKLSKGATFYVVLVEWDDEVTGMTSSTEGPLKDFGGEDVVAWSGKDDQDTFDLKPEDVIVKDGKAEYKFQTKTNKITVNRLYPGTNYKVYIKSVGLEGKMSEQAATMEKYTMPATTAVTEITEITMTSISLTWEQLKGTEEFMLDLTNVEDKKSAKVTLDTTQTTFHDLQPGTYYQISVFSIGVDGKMNPNGSPPISVQTLPAKPLNLIAPQVTTTTINLKWDSVKGGKEYNVITKLDPDLVTDFYNDIVTDTSHLLERLEEGTEYYIQVFTISTTDGRSNGSDILQIRTVPQTPSQPSITDITETGVIVRWVPVKGSERYILNMTSQEGKLTETSTDLTEIVVSDLVPGTFYTFSLRSIGTEERVNVVPSDSVTIQTVPSKPSGIEILDVTTQQISLKWSAVKGASYYKVTYLTINRFGSNGNEQTLMTNRLDIVLTDLLSGTVYQIFVTAVSPRDRISQSSEVVEVATVPSKVEELEVEGVTEFTASLSWKSVTGAESYEITVMLPDSRLSPVLQTIKSVTNRFIVEKLSPGKVYSFEVKALGKQERVGEISDRVSVQTVPRTPYRMVIGEITNTTIAVNWSPVVGVDFYQISITNVADSTMQVVRTKLISQVITNLKPGTLYNFFIQSIGFEGAVSKESPHQSFYTVPALPTGLKAVKVTTDSIQFQWNSVSGAKNYQAYLRLRDDVTRRIRFRLFTDELTSTFENLKPGIVYDITVTAIGEDDKESEQGEGLVVQTVPPVVNGLFVTAVDETSVSLKWTPATGAIKYVVVIQDETTLKEERKESATDTFIASDLQPGTWYKFSVLSVGMNNRVNVESSLPIREQTVSSQTKGMRFSDISTNSIRVHWEEAIGAESYNIFVRDFLSSRIVQTKTSNTPSILIMSLTPGVRYSFSVTSTSARNKDSVESEPMHETTLINPPTGVRAIVTTNSTLMLTWVAAEGAVEYIIKAKEQNTDLEQMLKSRTNSFTVENLEAGTWYNFNIISVGKSGIQSGESEVLSAQTTPGVPSGLSVDGVTTDSIAVRWEPVEGAKLYIVTVSPRVVSLSDAKDRLRSWDTISTNAVLDSLRPGTNFYIKVVAIGDSERSAESKILVENTLPETPSNVKVDTVTSTSLTVSWDNMDGAASYEIDVKRMDIEENFDFISTESFITINDLSEGGIYQITVTSLDGKQRTNGIASEPVEVQTVPSAPGSISLVEVTKDSIEITWQPVYGATSYTVTAKYTKTNGERATITQTATTTSTTFTDLPQPGTEYTFNVAAIGSEFTSEASNDFVENTLPLLPENIIFGEVTTTTVAMSWDLVKGADSYGVEVTRIELGTSEVEFTNRNSIVVSGLTPGAGYSISIYSQDAKKRTTGEKTDPLKIQTGLLPPTGLTVTDVIVNNMTVQWDQVFGAKSYIVIARWQVQSASGLRNMRQEFPSVKTTTLLVLPESGIDYTLSVVAVGEELKSVESRPIIENTMLKTPLVPNVYDITTTTMTLDWEGVEGAKGYNIFVTRVDISSTQKVFSPFPSTILNGLIPGALYNITIFSVDMRGRLSKTGSNVVQIQTEPSMPTSHTITDVTTTSVSFTWLPVRGVDSYIVSVSEVKEDKNNPNFFGNTAQNSVYLFQLAVTGSETTIRGLTPGTSYIFSIIAMGKYQTQRKSKSLEIKESTLPQTPDPITLGDITAYNAAIQWNSVKGATSYMIEYTKRRDNIIKSIQVEDESYILRGLTPGNWYEVTILSFDKLNRTSNKKSIMVPFQTAPQKAKNITVTEVTTTSIFLQWQPIPDSVSYVIGVYWLEDNSIKKADSTNVETLKENSITLTTTKTEKLISNLQPGTDYWLTLSSIAQSGIKSAPSDRILERTVPIVPEGPNVTVSGQKVATLKWKPVKGAIGYKVSLQSWDKSSDVIEKEVKNTETSFGNLSPGTVYNVFVYAIGDKQRMNEDPSPTVTFKTVPGISNGFTVTDVGSTYITLSWVPSKGGSHFEITRENESKQTATFETTSNTFTLEDLTPGETYTLTVTTYGDEKMTKSSGKSRPIVQMTVPETPKLLTIREVTETSMALSWQASQGATSYIVKVINTLDNEEYNIDAGSRLSINVNDLASGVVYQLSVQSVADQSNLKSIDSEPVSQRTIVTPPAELRATTVEQNSVTIAWNKVQGGHTYELTVYEVQSQFQKPEIQRIERIDVDTIIVDKLKAGTEYEYVLFVKSEENVRSRRSVKLMQMTAPKAPEGLKTTNVETTSFVIEWKLSKGVSSYIITLANTDTELDERFTVFDDSSLIVSDLQPGVMYSITMEVDTGRSNVEAVASKSIFQRTKPLPPQSLRVTEVLTNSISLTWDTVIGASSYVVNVNELSNGRFVPGKLRRLNSNGNNAYTVSELKLGTQYEFSVKAVTEENLESENSDGIRQFSRPQIPQNIAISSVKLDSFVLTWTQSKGATSYIIQVVNEDSLEDKTLTVGNVKSLLIKDLEAGTNYVVSMKAVVPGDLESEQSTELRQITAPETPTGFAVSDVKQQSITLRWNSVKGASSYTLFQREIPSMPGARPLKEVPIIGIRNTQKFVGTLKPGTKYQFQIIAATTGGLKSARSEVVSQRTIPPPPQGIILKNIKTNSMTVAWERSTGATSYTLTITNQDTLEEETMSVRSNNEYTFRDLLPGTMYSITLQAEVDDEELSSLPSASVQKRTLPLAPQNVMVTNLGANSLQVNWDAVTGASNYMVYIYAINSFGRRAPGSQIKPMQVIGTQAIVNRLQSGIVYEFEIVATTSGGVESERSEPVRKITKFPAPIMPQYRSAPVELTEVGKTEMRAQWPQIRFSFKYTLILRSNSAPDRFIRDLSQNQHRITGLMPDTEYEVTFFATGRSDDESAESSPAARTRTNPEAPESVTNIRATEVTHNYIKLEWDEGERADYYVITQKDNSNNKIFTVDQVFGNQQEFFDLKTGNTYTFRIISVGRFENSSWSSPITIKAEHPVPVMPTGLTSPPIRRFEVTHNSAAITFPFLENAVSYNIIIRKSQGKLFKELKNIKQDSVTITDLEQATVYFITYQAVGGNGEKSEESSPELVITTKVQVPDVPSGHKIRDITAETVILSWLAADRAISYSVRILSTTTGFGEVFTQATSPFTVTDLKYAHEYEISVKSVGRSGESEYAKPIKFRTILPPVGNITQMAVEFITQNTIWLSWSPAKYALSYSAVVYHENTVVQEVKGIKGNAVKIYGLKPALLYRIGVQPHGYKVKGEIEPDPLWREVRTHSPLSDLSSRQSFAGFMSDVPDVLTDRENAHLMSELQGLLRKMVERMIKVPKTEVVHDYTLIDAPEKPPATEFRDTLKNNLKDIEDVVQRMIKLLKPEQKVQKSAGVSGPRIDLVFEELVNISKFFKKKLDATGSSTLSLQISELLTHRFLKANEGPMVTNSLRNILWANLKEIIDNVEFEFVVELTNTTDSSVSLSITGVPRKTTLEVIVRHASNKKAEGTAWVSADTDELTFDNLEDLTTYEVVVQDKETGRMMALRAFSTPISPSRVAPSVPVDLTAIYVTRNIIGIRWRPSKTTDSAVSHTVRIYKDFSFVPILVFKDIRRSTFYVSRLTRNQRYYFTVTSMDIRTKLESPESSRLMVKTKYL